MMDDSLLWRELESSSYPSSQEFQDTMQICLNGHVTNDSYHRAPEYNQKYCKECSAPTIIKCDNCNTPIPGHEYISGVIGIFEEPITPNSCTQCGKKFPWADKLQKKGLPIKNEPNTQNIEKNITSEKEKKKYNDWEVMKRLSGGGQGNTYLVKKEDSNEQYVLKELRLGKKSRKALKRFKFEIEALSVINHENVLKIVDFNIDNEIPYLVTEYCVGGTLADVKLFQYSLIDKLNMFRQICNGVLEAHNKNIIHRDIKPANIYLKEDGKTPVIGDFGICFFTEKEERLTAIKEVVGPRFFIAPELEDGILEKITPKSDIYSLGKILYWLISCGGSFAREKHHHPQYDLTKQFPSSASYLINTFLDKMIVENPNGRCKDMGKVIVDLDILIRRIRMNAHVIDLNVPQHCNYCGVGNYEKAVEYSYKHHIENMGAIKNFGFTGVGAPEWLIFVCNYCANVQIFRPDYSENENAWREPEK